MDKRVPAPASNSASASVLVAVGDSFLDVPAKGNRRRIVQPTRCFPAVPTGNVQVAQELNFPTTGINRLSPRLPVAF